MGSKMFMGGHKTQKMAWAFVDFLEWYHKDGDQFLSHIIQVTGNETWISFVNAENQRAVKGVDVHMFTKQAEKV
jgi:hypothetical protein